MPNKGVSRSPDGRCPSACLFRCGNPETIRTRSVVAVSGTGHADEKCQRKRSRDPQVRANSSSGHVPDHSQRGC